MTVYYAGSEMDCFYPNGTQVETNQTASNMDAAFSRASTAAQYFSIFDTPVWGPLTSGWCHMTINSESSGNANQDNQFIEFLDSDTGQVVMQIDTDNGVFNLEYWNGSGFTQLAPAIGISNDVTYKLDFHWIIADTDGVFEVYLNEVLAATFTGDTLRTGFTQISKIRFRSTSHTQNSGLYIVYFSEIIVADVDTRGWHLRTLVPNGVGSSTAWTNDFNNIDAVGTNGHVTDDRTFISSDTAEQIELHTIQDLGASFQVEAVVVAARSKVTEAGPQNLQMAIRTGGSNFFSPNITIGTGWGSEQNVWDTNPDTGLIWTNAEVDALEIGVKSKT